MDSGASSRVFLVCLALSLAVHAALLAVTRLSRPVREAELSFTVEILPLQPVTSAPAPSPAAAPAPPPPAPQPKADRPHAVARLPSPAPAVLPAERPPEAPAASVAATAPESPRAADRTDASLAAERRADAAPPAAPAPAAAPVSDAAYLRNKLEYPLSAVRNGEQGTVLVRVLVAKDGSVLKAELEKTSGSPNLDGAAVRSIRKWHFTPARRGEEAIEKEYVVPAIFKLENPRR